MIPTKTLILNFALFIILVIRPRVLAVMMKYEEPFPPRFPVQVKSQVAFTQYANVPMLSLDEIKNDFPWLKMAPENIADRKDTRSSTKGGPPRYVFYYIPTEVGLDNPGPGNPKYHENPKPEKERRNLLRGKNNDHRFYLKANKPGASAPKESGKKPRPIISRNKSIKDEKSESKIKTRNGGVAAIHPRNHKFKDQDLPDGNRVYETAETRSVPNYSYPKVPSAYMQPPKTKFEEKEFWVKNKRKSKGPIPVEDQDTNEERLKNHRIVVKKKKSKNNNPENEERLKNHKPTYDREHDPEERTESPSGKVERLHKRPKESPKESGKNPLLLSQDGERVEFHIHGHEGPQTYIFGYDTGNGKNRHFRLEERFRDGSVKGHYGYYDPNGKLKMVEYKARPMEGYEERHHESQVYESDQKSNGETES